MAVHAFYFAVIRNIDPRASLFVIFVLISYITIYDRFSGIQRKNRL
jgi:hypothetical protein